MQVVFQRPDLNRSLNWATIHKETPPPKARQILISTPRMCGTLECTTLDPWIAWIDGAGQTGYLLEHIPFLRAHRKTNINVGVIISCKITRHKREKKSREPELMYKGMERRAFPGRTPHSEITIKERTF